MPQSLIQMPKTADFKISRWDITIRNHKVVNSDGLFGIMVDIIHKGPVDMEKLAEFEKQGISYEMVIEYCAQEMESNTKILGDLIYWYYCLDIWNGKIKERYFDEVTRFSEGVTGRSMAEQLVEKIRSCDDWGELCRELNMTSKFQQGMEKRIKQELKQCRKV